MSAPRRPPAESQDDLRDTYGHTPVDKMFGGRDVYGVGFEPRRAGRRPVRLAVIGAGGVVQSKYLPAIARLRMLWDPVELVALADPDEAQGPKVARVQGCRWYSDHRTLLDREQPDAVVVASPDALHALHARDALERGVAALVEKPFTLALAEARELCALAERHDVLLIPVTNLRFAPPFRRAGQLVRDSRAFAAPGLFLGRMHLGYDYVALLEDATVHLLDLARFFMGDVRSVDARGVGRGHDGYPFRTAAMTLAFESGSIGQVATSSAALSLKPWLRVEVHGDGEWLAVDDVYELAVYDSEVGPTKTWRPVMASTLVLDEELGGHVGQLEHFLQVLRHDEPPLVEGRDGCGAIELAIAAHLSVARGTGVDLPLDPAEADREVRVLGFPPYGNA